MNSATRSWGGALGLAAAILLMIVLFLALGPQTTLLVLIGLIVVAVLIRFPITGLYALIFILPFGDLVTQVLGTSTLSTVYGGSKDFIVLFLTLLTILSGKIRAVPTPLIVLVLLVVASGALSGIFTADSQQAIFGWRNDYEPLLLLIVVPAFVKPHQVRRMLGVIIALGQVTAAIAIYTWNIGLDWLFTIGRLPVAAGEDFPTSLFSAGSTRPRAFSPYVAPNEMAVVTDVVIAIIWCIPGLKARYRILLTILPAIAVFLTESRSGIIGAAVLLCVLAARGIYKRARILTGAFILIAALGVATGTTLYIRDQLGSGDDPSVGGHSVSLQYGINLFIQNPLGIGLGKVGPRSGIYDESVRVESYLLVIGLEAGIITLLMYLALMAYIASRSLRTHNDLGFLAAAALSASLVSQIVLPALQTGSVSFTLWLVVGLSIAAAKLAKKSDVQESDEINAPPPKVVAS